MSTPVSITFTVCREQNQTLATTAHELMSFTQIGDAEDVLAFASQQLLIRIETVFSLAITGVMTCVHGVWELLLLNRRILIERELLSFALIKVNVLFIATVAFSTLLQVCALISPELSYSWLKLHLFIDSLIGALLAEIPGSLQALGARLNMDFSSLPVPAQHLEEFRDEMRLELTAGMSAIYSKHATSSFSQYDWSMYKEALSKVLKRHYTPECIDPVFTDANQPVRARFYKVMTGLIEAAKRDLLQREIYRPIDFQKGDNAPANRAAELIAIYSLVQASEELADGYLIKLPQQTFFLSHHTTSDPLDGVQSRGFGVEVTPEGLYTRVTQLKSLVDAVDDKESLREYLQEEFVDESELRKSQAVPVPQNFFRHVDDAAVDAEATRKQLIAEARAHLTRQNAAPAAQNDVKALAVKFRGEFDAETRWLFRRALFYGIQLGADVTPQQKKAADALISRFGIERMSEMPDVLFRQRSPATIKDVGMRNGVLDLVRSYPAVDQRASLGAYIKARCIDPSVVQLAERVRQYVPLQQALQQVYALTSDNQALLYRLLSPRSTRDPGAIEEREVKDAYLHLTTLHRLVKTYVLELQG